MNTKLFGKKKWWKFLVEKKRDFNEEGRHLIYKMTNPFFSLVKKKWGGEEENKCPLKKKKVNVFDRGEMRDKRNKKKKFETS